MVMLPNGRQNPADKARDTNSAVRSAITSNFPQNPATDGKAALQGVTASLIQFDPKLVEQGTKIILRSAKESGTLSAELFAFFRECEDEIMADNTLRVAEGRVLKSMNESGVKTMADLAALSGVKQLSYVSLKSNLVGTSKNSAELCQTLQDWYDFEETHNKEPGKIVADGFLNIWSNRYKPAEGRNAGSGSTLFFRDLRVVQKAKRDLAAGKKRIAKDSAKGGTTDASGVTPANGVDGGMRSGGRQKGTLSEVVQLCLNNLITKVHNSFGTVSDDFMVAVLKQAETEIGNEAYRIHQEQSASASSNKPSQSIADALKGVIENEPQHGDVVPESGESDDMPELSEEDLKNIEDNAPDDEVPQAGNSTATGE